MDRVCVQSCSIPIFRTLPKSRISLISEAVDHRWHNSGSLFGMGLQSVDKYAIIYTWESMSHLLSIWVWKLQETLDFGILKASMSFSGKCPSNKTSLFSFCILLFHPFPTLCQLLYPPVFTVFFLGGLLSKFHVVQSHPPPHIALDFALPHPVRARRDELLHPIKVAKYPVGPIIWTARSRTTDTSEWYICIFNDWNDWWSDGQLKHNDAGWNTLMVGRMIHHSDESDHLLRCLCSRISTWVSCN